MVLAYSAYAGFSRRDYAIFIEHTSAASAALYSGLLAREASDYGALQ